jgi:PAS domain S-box-containing protein
MADEPTTLLDALESVAIQGYDAERRVFYWNEASEALYGYSRAEALGQRLEDLIIPDELRDAVIREINAWLGGGPPPSGGEIRLRHRDGHLIEVHSNHLSLPDESGTPRLFCIDVLVRDQESLESMLDGAPVPDMSAGVVASLSHEVRTPLNAILGFSELAAARVRPRLPDDPVTQYFQHIENAGRELSHILDQSLAAMGDTLTDLTPRPRLVEVQDVLVEVASLMIALHPNHGSPLEVRSLPGHPRCRFDPFLTKQAVAALTRFAMANSAGGAPVTLSAQVRADVSDMVLFLIEDNGPQLPYPIRIRLLSGQPLNIDAHRSENQSGLFQLSIAQRIALATGSMLAFDRTDAGTNKAVLAVRSLPDGTSANT